MVKSQRVKRGFFRIGMVGAAIGAIGCVACFVVAGIRPFTAPYAKCGYDLEHMGTSLGGAADVDDLQKFWAIIRLTNPDSTTRNVCSTKKGRRANASPSYCVRDG